MTGKIKIWKKQKTSLSHLKLSIEYTIYLLIDWIHYPCTWCMFVHIYDHLLIYIWGPSSFRNSFEFNCGLVCNNPQHLFAASGRCRTGACSGPVDVMVCNGTPCSLRALSLVRTNMGTLEQASGCHTSAHHRSSQCTAAWSSQWTYSGHLNKNKGLVRRICLVTQREFVFFSSLFEHFSINVLFVYVTKCNNDSCRYMLNIVISFLIILRAMQNTAWIYQRDHFERAVLAAAYRMSIKWAN